MRAPDDAAASNLINASQPDFAIVDFGARSEVHFEVPSVGRRLLALAIAEDCRLVTADTKVTFIG